MKIDSGTIIQTVKAISPALSKAPLLKMQQCDTVSFSSKLSNAEISNILSNLASPNTKIDVPVLTGLLNKNLKI